MTNTRSIIVTAGGVKRGESHRSVVVLTAGAVKRGEEVDGAVT